MAFFINPLSITPGVFEYDYVTTIKLKIGRQRWMIHDTRTKFNVLNSL